MGRLADKIKNLMKKGREPVVGDIEMDNDDEPEVGDIEMLDDEEGDVGDIVVISAKDLENEDNDEFEKFSDESTAYGNRKMDSKRNKEPKRDEEWGATVNELMKHSGGELDAKNNSKRADEERKSPSNFRAGRLEAGIKASKDEMRGKNNKISDKDEAPSRNAKLAQMLGKKYARR